MGILDYGVLMSIRLTVKGEVICKGKFQILQKIDVVEDFLPPELGSSNAHLVWLETLAGGEYKSTHTLTMKFKEGGGDDDNSKGSQSEQIFNIVEVDSEGIERAWRGGIA